MFHKKVESILNESNLDDKFIKFKIFYDDFKLGRVEFEDNFIPKILKKPSFSRICKVLPAKDIPKFKDDKKEAFFLHSIAHIEYSAIDLALDDCYRFVKLPLAYYEDWLEVASDEIRHFTMISDELLKLGYKYGDFPVHDGLFFGMKNTQNSLLERMAIMHKYMEANGLDANYFMLKKIKNDSSKKELKNLLNQILEEEISHVKKGNYWFEFACKKEGISKGIFIDIVMKHYPKFKNIKKELNINDRIRAGFTEEEIKILNNKP
ncbi:DUF455 domain-containing protein [Campylobacter blaseri]|uniref:Ferritin n=1 Tax=Campylobacter blaseri TaxID=2042961 RepID=A0A2P8QYU9_9BACT|nr:ferritin-like domain-containing protein [Campylobacter blaseri]PSM51413.1 ferritin [Campylobacter blaseri]PSM52863.1 ferritin [Campylobacter blaseri]QKF86167.1 DUF455 domain-containing protein [Campylobacter blaseri]